MTDARKFEFDLFEKVKEFTNSKTGEKFKASTLEGYLVYDGNPIHKASGRRIEDRIINSSKTGKPFTIKKYALNLLNGEGYDKDLREEGTLFLKMDERVTRKDNTPFSVLRTDSHWFGTKEDERNAKGLRIGNMIIPFNGIIETRETQDQFGDTVRRVRLAVNDYAQETIVKDMLKPAAERAGYTMETEDEMFPEEVLVALKEQFKYYDSFKRAFEGHKEEVKEKVTPANF